MNFLTDDYHTLAMRTAAGPEVFHVADDGPERDAMEHELIVVLMGFYEAAMQLDRFKSMLFYGKDKPVAGAADMLRNMSDKVGMVPDHMEVKLSGATPQTIHAILGIASESGELVENLLQLFTYDSASLRADVHNNIARETGDIDWFQELLAHASGVPVDQARSENIARLRARFPDKFTESDAVARADEA